MLPKPRRQVEELKQAARDPGKRGEVESVPVEDFRIRGFWTSPARLLWLGPPAQIPE